ncbi:NADAR family protein [Streptomyces sp. NPDC005438]|uniref:NADAR family protein n=1 Tax=Streptomyces sp. NPDC005438 TaxID=3156880 RepID=UPI0033B7E840
MRDNRTLHRRADGVLVPGTWRPVFLHNAGTHYLTDLRIYADGIIDCGELATLDRFEELLRQGRVATRLPEGAWASGTGLAAWRFHQPHSHLTPELLVAEVRDTVDELNGRPDSTGRCLAAVDTFLADRTEENRAAARTAYLAIPETRRRYALGDMDRQDEPLRVLVAGPGGQVEDTSDEPVTEGEYQEALEYFAERARWIAEAPSRTAADGPATPYAPAVHLHQSHPLRRQANPDIRALRNDYPAPVTVDGITHPTVTHAYWAASVTDPTVRQAIREANNAFHAHSLTVGTPPREGWDQARTAVMARLMRAKYDQHPDLAEILLSTGDATLVYDDGQSGFWGDEAGRGRNWVGRLLELVRSELAAHRAGIA